MKILAHISLLLLFYGFAHGTPWLLAQDGLPEGGIHMEAESLHREKGWEIGDSMPGYGGDGYIYWEGKDYFTEPGKGLLEVIIPVSKAGTYIFCWRTKVGEGLSSTDFNDSWVRFPDADDFFAQKDKQRIYPHGSGKQPLPNGAGAQDWFKVYAVGSTEWTWSSYTSDDDGHQVCVQFDQPGYYTLQISARSRLHLIDQICLYPKPAELIYSPTCTLPEGVALSGETKRWHKVSLTFEGPETSEMATPNPFMDYRLEVRFTHEDGTEYKVPGFYAACGDAANAHCEAGNKWRVHFSPDRIGKWTWEASFWEGKEVAVGEKGTPSPFIHGKKGQLEISLSDKKGKDFRQEDLGRLAYVGKRYLRFTGNTPANPSGPWFLKAGADAPENSLAYVGFDGTPNQGNRRKSWLPHALDYHPWEAQSYNWSYDKGSAILGMIHYLHTAGMNAFSFLTFSAGGDDENVFPHLLRVSDSAYESLDKSEQWETGLYPDRFDCSKLDQWEQVFSFADAQGVYLHFKLNEEENEAKMDGGHLGRERKAYYREMVARFGHHLALNWNLGEESGPPIEPYMSDEQRLAVANFIHEIDPYQHHTVVHTRPDQQAEVYVPLLGKKEISGASVQCESLDVHGQILRWIAASDEATHPWVVANDEQGPYPLGVGLDLSYASALPDSNQHPDNRDAVRKRVLWGTLMAGGAGVEYYYGYETGCTDLNCEDHRTRASKWRDAHIALTFFDTYLNSSLPSLISQDSLTDDPEDYVLAKEGEIYVVYRPNGGSCLLSIPDGLWRVRWFDPKKGGMLSPPIPLVEELKAPDSLQDWVALILPVTSSN